MSLIVTPESDLPALIVPQTPSVDGIKLTPDAIGQKQDCVELLQDIVAVNSVKERDDAIAAASLAKGVLKKFTESKDVLKGPALRICQRIDELARDYSNSIKAELDRVERLASNYQAQVLARIEAERNLELADMQKEITGSGMVDMDKLREHAARKAELNEPIRVQGASTRQQLDYDLTDLDALYQHSKLLGLELVKLEASRSALLAYINTPGFVSAPGITTRLSTKLHAK